MADLDQRDSREQQEDDQEMTAAEAGEMLGIGHTKLAQLLKVGEEAGEHGLPSRRSMLDNRVRMVKRSAVERLLRQSSGMTVEEARKQLGVSRVKMKALIEEGMLPVRTHPLSHKKRIVDPDRYAELLAERRARPQKGSVEQGKDSSC